jgi:death-on-curing protein
VKRWRWVREDVVYAVHDRQLAEHGGPAGVRDAGALASALARPRNLAAYEKPGAAALAAAYAYGLVRNHPFADGNKRTGWVVARLFLAINGFGFLPSFDPQDAVRTIAAVAAGTLSESELVEWFRQRVRRIPPKSREP